VELSPVPAARGAPGGTLTSPGSTRCTWWNSHQSQQNHTQWNSHQSQQNDQWNSHQSHRTARGTLTSPGRTTSSTGSTSSRSMTTPSWSYNSPGNTGTSVVITVLAAQAHLVVYNSPSSRHIQWFNSPANTGTSSGS